MADLIKKIIDGVKDGEYHVIFCEPLKSMHQNLAFCPYRDECEQLDIITSSTLDPSKIQELVVELTCWNCPRDEWLVVVSEQNAIATFAVDPDTGKHLKEILEKIESIPEPIRDMVGLEDVL